MARSQLATLGEELSVRYLVGLPRPALLDEVSKLWRDTIVLFLTNLPDGAGQDLVPADMAREVASASAAPVSGLCETYLDRGVVGGHMDATEPKGMGIGLSICRSIVEAHGGRLSAASGTP